MKLEILSNNFYEGEFVTVVVEGKEVTRKVYYSKSVGDLYINYKGLPYFLYEFEKGHTGDELKGDK